MTDEYIDYVDANDHVIGTTTRTEIYAKQLRHRIAHVFLMGAAGTIALAKRGKNVAFCPDHWVSTAAGHVSAGESYLAAAMREMNEEIGVQVPLTPCGVLPYLKPGTHHEKFLGTFRADYTGSFVYHPHEVQFVQYFSLDEIRAMLRAGEPFHPESVALLTAYFL